MDAHHGLGPVTSKVYIGEPGPGTIIVKCQSYWNLLSGVAWSSCLPIAALYPPLWLAYWCYDGRKLFNNL